MGTDHGILCTWQTQDLIYRDQKLRAKTVVCGMSRNAMIIHIVALVVTSGTSLPINLLFGIRQAATYNEVKHERHSIRQILGKRNVTYAGRGQWVIPGQVLHPGPGPGPWMGPNMTHPGPWTDPNVTHPGPWTDPNVGQRVNPSVMHYHGPVQWPDPNGGNNNNNGSDGLLDQYAQAAEQATVDAATNYFDNNGSTDITTTLN